MRRARASERRSAMGDRVHGVHIIPGYVQLRIQSFVVRIALPKKLGTSLEILSQNFRMLLVFFTRLGPLHGTTATNFLSTPNGTSAGFLRAAKPDKRAKTSYSRREGGIEAT